MYLTTDQPTYYLPSFLPILYLSILCLAIVPTYISTDLSTHLASYHLPTYLFTFLQSQTKHWTVASFSPIPTTQCCFVGSQKH